MAAVLQPASILQPGACSPGAHQLNLLYPPRPHFTSVECAIAQKGACLALIQMSKQLSAKVIVVALPMAVWMESGMPNQAELQLVHAIVRSSGSLHVHRLHMTDIMRPAHTPVQNSIYESKLQLFLRNQDAVFVSIQPLAGCKRHTGKCDWHITQPLVALRRLRECDGIGSMFRLE
eukprot:363357-Chlamydomonas_euryale.AAC.9